MNKDRINRVVELVQGDIDDTIWASTLCDSRVQKELQKELLELADALIAALDAYIAQNRQCWEGVK